MLWKKPGPQRRAEELRDQLDLLWDLVPVPLLHVGADGRILRANEAAGRLVGLRASSLVGFSLRDLLERSSDSLRFLRALPPLYTRGGRLRLRRVSGEVVEVEARGRRAADGSAYLAFSEPPGIHGRPPVEWIRGAITDLPVAVGVYDPEGNAVVTNPAWQRLFGIPPEEAGHLLRDSPVFNPGDRPLLEAALRGHVVRLPPREWTPPDGSAPRVVEMVLAPLRDPRGTLHHIAAFAHDVTGRWRIEESLRESEARYRVLIEGSPDAMFLLEDGLFRFVNRSFVHLFGVSSVEAVHRIGLLALCVEEDRPRVAEYLADRLAQRGREEAVVFRGRRSDGSVITCELRANRVLLEGKPVLMGILRDITHERHMEQALRFQAELLECVHDAIIATDWEGRILYCNRACEALYAWRAEEVVGRRLQDLLRPEGRSFDLDRIRAVLQRAGRWRGELQHRREDGHLVWLSATLSVNRNEAGEAVGIVGVYRDVTEQKRLEEQLIQAQKMESLGTLAGGIAHDFNNILGSIVGYLGLIKEDLPAEATLRQYFEVVERSALRASELTRQLLGFARRGKFTVQRVQLRTLCEEVLNLFRSTLHERIEVRTRFPEDLPEVEGDPAQLQQVVLNLCMNAKDAMPQGGVLTLELGEALADDPTSQGPPDLRRYVVLTVRDTGVGMDDYVKSRVFEPFFTTKEPGKGTGLGMAMVYGIVRNHGGFVDLQSEVGKGTTVQVYLPVPVESQPQPEEEAATGVAEGSGELILVVDDEEPLCNLLREVLTRRGYRVLVARSGEEAVDLYQQWRDEVDLVILDMVMPGMSGAEAFEAILRLNPKARVLLSSGYTQEGAAGELLRKGARGFLQKPYLITELTAKVREALEPKDG
ncbi:MAG: PAS domain S-box protein [Armatimonadota bacterium]|nr:PAS domain S-box protein [Armatimonadota bacterium]MDR7444780.1 PAS domain S-box protein [Armatimonadota bacterium]MDR7613337.1 PAS domain S-box protein [Armatimonadota bacterium]